LGFAEKISDKRTLMDNWEEDALWVCIFEWQGTEIHGIAQMNFTYSDKIGDFFSKAKPLVT
jgi:hypothetical protein